MALYTDLSVSAQASYAGLDVAARDADVRRSVAGLPGGALKKTIKRETTGTTNKSSPTVGYNKCLLARMTNERYRSSRGIARQRPPNEKRAC